MCHDSAAGRPTLSSRLTQKPLFGGGGEQTKQLSQKLLETTQNALFTRDLFFILNVT